MLIALLAALNPALACGPYGAAAPVTAQAPDSAWTAESYGSTILLYNTQTEQSAWIHSAFPEIYTLTFSEGGLMVYGSHPNHAAVLFSLAGEPLQTWTYAAVVEGGLSQVP